MAFRARLNWLATPMTAFLLLHCVGVTHAQPQRRGLPAPTETVVPDGSVEVPMHRIHMLPAVDVMIDGAGPYRLIVDTGAPGVALDRKIAEALDLKAPPGMPAGMQVQVSSGSGAGVPASLVHIDEVSIGGATIKGLWTVAMDMPFGDLDGVIGMGVFNDCLLTYDYPAGRIVLEQGALPEPDGKDVLSYEPRSARAHPVIEIGMGGRTESFLVDTGMAGWFSVDRDELGDIGFKHGPVAGMMGMRVDRKMRTEMGRLETDLTIGDHVIENPTVRVGEENMIGTLFLQQFVFTVDGKNRRLRLTRSSDATITSPSLRGLGVSLRAEDGAMVVWDVHPDGPAVDAGIEVGDRVLTIDGKPAHEIYGTMRWIEYLASAKSVSLGVVSASVDGDDDAAAARTVDIAVWELVP